MTTTNRDTIIHQHGPHAVLADSQPITMADGTVTTLHRVARNGQLAPLLRALVLPHAIAVFDLRALIGTPPPSIVMDGPWIAASIDRKFSGAAAVQTAVSTNLSDVWGNPTWVPMRRIAA
ncbi:hypothetical protein [Ideonella paludis]|uniref:Hedgehog/Intein (Hint) domain-containing protein n=1 Tax=Ideonella paludis TaxID=1233411 RepID=A0ABS5DU24_9BURK|nr:hypothetical protein [Ideonella paludis]MBQ0934624.1 hypothetical protein [Ideonella paludis]